MSLSKEVSSDKSSRPRLSWGVRFAIASIGTVLLWSLTEHWMRASEQYYEPSNLIALSILAKHIVVPLLCLAFFIWTVALLWKQRFFLVQWLQLTDRQQARFSAIFVFWGLLDLGISFAARSFSPHYMLDRFLGASPPVFLTIWVGSVYWVARANSLRANQPSSTVDETSRRGLARFSQWWSVRENRINSLSIFILAMAFLHPHGLVYYLALSALLVVVMQVLTRRYGWIIELTMRGHYNFALWLNRLTFWIPGSGGSIKGWILGEAGLYAEALAFYKPEAFDANGLPLLTDWNLYLYAFTLLSGDDESAARELFEAAVLENQVQLKSYFSLGLADCLLTQKQEPDRARALIEQAIIDRSSSNPTARSNADAAHLKALHAYAVAACGQREEALILLREATTVSAVLRKRDLAALRQIEGLTWQALGDLGPSRIAFEDALALHPHGDIALRARKKLKELAGKPDA